MPLPSDPSLAPPPGTDAFARVLDLLAQVRQQRTFGAQAMIVCNELARHYGCRQVALGWQEGRYLRLKALNERARFERKMDLVQQIEAAMEEALDQDNEIRLPAAGGARQVTAEHEMLAQAAGTPFLATIPLRPRGEPAAAVLLQRDDRPFSDPELVALRLLADHLADPLADRHERDRWLGHRLRRFIESHAQRAFRLDHFWPHVAAVSGVIGLALLLLVKVDYFVEAPFILRAEVQAIVAAPFPGYVAGVHARTGDAVERGQVLVTLEPRELLLQQALLQAEVEQFTRDQREARDRQDLPRMQIAEARRRQSEAGLRQVEFQLENTRIAAPLRGTVVEDHDLSRRIGAPVQKGETLMALSQLDRFYAEIAIRERDVHLVQPADGGRLIFLSAPLEAYPFAAVQLEPAGQPTEQGNTVLGRAPFGGDLPPWWRPGLSGTAKLHGGRHSPAWILTHRFIDWVRYRLWW